MEKKIKDTTILIRLTKEQKKEMQELAKKEQRSLSNYIVHSLLGSVDK